MKFLKEEEEEVELEEGEGRRKGEAVRGTCRLMCPRSEVCKPLNLQVTGRHGCPARAELKTIEFQSLRNAV